MTLQLPYFDGTSDQVADFPLSGAAFNLAVSGNGNFGNVPVDSTNTATLLLANDGVTLIAELGTGMTLPAPFFFPGGSFPGTGGTASSNLGAGQSCTIVVGFDPTAAGTFSDTLQIPYYDGSADQTANYQVSGVAQTPANLSISDLEHCTSRTTAVRHGRGIQPHELGPVPGEQHRGKYRRARLSGNLRNRRRHSGRRGQRHHGRGILHRKRPGHFPIDPQPELQQRAREQLRVPADHWPEHRGHGRRGGRNPARRCGRYPSQRRHAGDRFQRHQRFQRHCLCRRAAQGPELGRDQHRPVAFRHGHDPPGHEQRADQPGGNIAGGTSGLTVTGSNALTLSGANAYSGSTTDDGATLLVDNTSGRARARGR